MVQENTVNDFSKGSVVKNILTLALPMTLAQLINILYNIVDRMYIGRIPDHATLSLTGLGLSMPIISAVIAFANLFGVGGAPLCSIARGKGDIKGAEKVVGNAFTMLLCTGVLLTVMGLLFKKPLLYEMCIRDSFLYRAASHISVYIGFAAQLFTEFKEFVGSEAVVFHNAAPMGVDHFFPVFLGADAVFPVIFIRKAAARPAQHGNLHFLQRLHHICPCLLYTSHLVSASKRRIWDISWARIKPAVSSSFQSMSAGRRITGQRIP